MYLLLGAFSTCVRKCVMTCGILSSISFQHKLRMQLWHVQGGLNVLEHDYSPVGFSDSVLQVADGVSRVLGGLETWPHQQDVSQSTIAAVSICAQFILIAQPVSTETSILTRVSLPDLQFHSTQAVSHPVQRMWINFDCSRVAILDQQVYKPCPQALLTLT